MSRINTVIKSNGDAVPFEMEKLNRMAQWAANIGISWFDCVLRALRKVEDRCTTAQLQEALIEACAEVGDKAHLDMAARLFLGTWYKEVHGSFEERKDFYDFYHDMVISGVWEEMDYDAEAICHFADHLDHGKDLTYSFSTLKQIHSKYSKKLDGVSCETPQFSFMGIAMKAMEAQPKNRRIEDVMNLYDYLSSLYINAPTPFLAGLRTPFKGYASCCVLKANDTSDSLEAITHAAYRFTVASAGIGAALETRSIDDPIRGGQIKHTGKLPYYRYLTGAVASTKQQVRGGSATTFFTIIDPEIDDLIRLKHPTTVSEKQNRGLDYSVGVNKLFAECVARGEDWMLCSYLHAPEVHEALYKGYSAFKTAYYNYLESGKPKKMVNSYDLLVNILKVRQDTGRLYINWIDEMNTHTPFLDPIHSSNLCMEIFLPTAGFPSVQDMYNVQGEGEIALCFLSSLVAGRIPDDIYDKVAYYALLMVDNVIDLMEYPFPQVEMTAKNRRSVGIGVTNLAHCLAKKGLKYTDQEGKDFMHQHAERHSFALHKASLQLAKEKGVAGWINKTGYPQGWLPIDTYNKNVDMVVGNTLNCDWEGLRQEILKVGGIRNSVLEATPPTESSSLASESTNGLYPIREDFVIKKSGTTKVMFSAPDIEELKGQYQYAWDVPTKDMIDCYAIYQKFHGQGISADLYTDFSKYTDEKVPASELVLYFLYATKMGVKSWYYQNSKGGIKEEVKQEASEIPLYDDDEDGCEGCRM